MPRTRNSSVELNDEANTCIEALRTLKGLPGYTGLSVDEAFHRAREAASEAVIKAYHATIKGAK